MAVELRADVSEQTRARYADESGYVERDGVRVYYEVYGSGEPTVLLLPTWSIIHSRQWKLQIPYLARHCRVLTFDGRGNGRSDRPEESEAYDEREFAAAIVELLMDAGRCRRMGAAGRRYVAEYRTHWAMVDLVAGRYRQHLVEPPKPPRPRIVARA